MQTPWGDGAVHDAHLHFFSRNFFENLAAQAGKSAAEIAASLGWDLPSPDPRELAARWIAELDRHGVERACLIASVPGDEASVLTAAQANPSRFWAYAMLNPLAEGARVAPGLSAICLFPAMHRYSMAGDHAAAILEQAASQGCAVFVHCGVLTVGVRKKLGLPSPFDMRYSNPLDLHAAALRHPSVRFVIPHFGAGFFREALMLADLCPNVFLDTSSGNSWIRYEGLDLNEVLRRALEVAGPRRLLFGSDSSFFPRGWNRQVFDIQTAALAKLGLGAADARAILAENLERVLG